MSILKSILNTGISTQHAVENEYAEFESSRNSYASLSAMVVGGGIGAAVGYKTIGSNAALNPNTIINPPNALGETGRGVSSKVKDTLSKSAQRKDARAKKTLEKLMTSDGIRKIIGQSEQRNALIQSLISTVGDSQMGFDPDHMLDHKEKLYSIIENDINADEAEEIIKGLVNEITSGTQEQRVRFASRIDEFSGLGPSLTAPSFEFNHQKKYNPIRSASGLSSKAADRFKRLKRLTGGGEGIELVQFDEKATGQLSQYARIQVGKEKHMLMPLDLHARRARPGMPSRLRTGAGGAASYALPEMFVPFSSAQDLVSQMGRGKVTKAALRGASTDVEDYFMDQFAGHVTRGQKGFRVRRSAEFGAKMTEFLTYFNPFGDVAGSTNFGVSDNINRAIAQNADVAVFYGFHGVDDAMRKSTIQGLISSEIDPNVGPSRMAGSLIDNRRFVTLGFSEGSVLSRFKSGNPLGSDRVSFPVTARLEQAAKREDLFIPSQRRGARQKYIGRRHVMGEGVFAGSGTANIHIRGETGTVTKPFLLDISADLREGADMNIPVVSGRHNIADLADKGMVLSATRDKGASLGTLLQTGSIKVMDPRSQKNLSTHSLNKIMGQFEAFQAGKVDTPFVTFKRSQLTKLGKQLGIGADKMQEIFVDGRTDEVSVALRTMESSNGKSMLHLAFQSQRNMETAKIFAPHLKATTFEVSSNMMGSILKARGIGEDFYQRYNIDVEDLLVGTADQFSKAEDLISSQVISGLDVLSNKRGFVASDYVEGFKGSGKLGTSNLARVTEAAIEHLASSGRGAAPGFFRDAGMVLTAAYAHKGSDVNMQNFRDMITQKFGDNAAYVMEGARSGMVFGATSGVPGAGVGDWKRAMGSADTRYFDFMRSRLASTGMSDANISDVLASVYKNKIGIGEQLASVGGMLDMQSSLVGMTNPASRAASAQVIGVEDLAGILANNDGSLSNFLKTQDKGILLDLTTASGVAGSRLAAEAKRITGQGQIFLPGSETIAQLKGVDIKGGDGITKAVGSEMERFIDRFAQDLMEVSGNTQNAKEHSARHLRTFKEDISMLVSKTFLGLTAGKLQNSQAVVASAYTVGGLGLSPKQVQLRDKARRASKGMNTFLTDAAFFGQLSGEDISRGEKAFRLERFFTGLERENVEEGLYSISTRHPHLSRGNIALAQAYRDVREVGLTGRQDHTWRTFMSTGKGKKALIDLQREVRNSGLDMKVTSFNDVAQLGDNLSTARKAFFTQMADSLSSFTNTGGRVFLDSQDMSLSIRGFKDPKLNFDMGIAGASFGDMDGDHYMQMMLNRKASNIISSTLGKGEAYFAADALYKAQSEIYGAAYKESLKGMAAGRPEQDAIQKAAEDYMKESGIKDATGGIDKQLGKLRLAIVQNEAANPELAAEALAILKPLQEHTTIKGKKLHTFMPLAAMFGKAVDTMVAGGGTGELMEQFERFAMAGGTGQTIMGRGITAEEDLMFEGMRVIQKDQQLTNFREAIQFMNESVVAQQAQGDRLAGVSVKQVARRIGSGNDLASQQNALRAIMFDSGASGAAGMAADAVDTASAVLGQAGRIGNSIASAVGAMDTKVMGSIALGVAGALAASSAVSHQGYDSAGIDTMRNTMRYKTQSMFSDQPNMAGFTSDDIGGQVQATNPVLDAPIIPTNVLNINKPSSYSVTGRLPGTQNMLNFVNTIGQTGYAGSVKINDMRRHITANYMDRINGEY